jgi:hypothetical protein
VSVVKSFIAQQEGVSVDRLRVLFAGQLLTDNQRLGEKKVVTDSVVQIMVRPEE